MHLCPLALSPQTIMEEGENLLIPYLRTVTLPQASYFVCNLLKTIEHEDADSLVRKSSLETLRLLCGHNRYTSGGCFSPNALY